MKNKELHLIGVGSTGSKLIASLMKKGVNAKYTYINDRILPDLEDRACFVAFIPEGRTLIVDGCEIRISDMEAPFTMPEQLNELLNHGERYVLFAGLGGYTGTYATEGLANLLTKHNKPFTIISSLPFSFEGNTRAEHANKIKKKFENTKDFYCLPLEEIRSEVGDMPLEDAFKIADEELFRVFQKHIYKTKEHLGDIG